MRNRETYRRERRKRTGELQKEETDNYRTEEETKEKTTTGGTKRQSRSEKLKGKEK